MKRIPLIQIGSTRLIRKLLSGGQARCPKIVNLDEQTSVVDWYMGGRVEDSVEQRGRDGLFAECLKEWLGREERVRDASEGCQIFECSLSSDRHIRAFLAVCSFDGNEPQTMEE
jgi:hypothetical protein